MVFNVYRLQLKVQLQLKCYSYSATVQYTLYNSELSLINVTGYLSRDSHAAA